MNITRFSFQHHQLTLAFVIAVFIFGLYSFYTLPRLEDPKVIIRTAVVITQYPGMSPTRIENLITQKLEENIRGMPEVESISSSSKPGISIIKVEIQDKYKKLEPIWNDLRNIVDDTRAVLPKEIQGPLVDTDYGRVTVASITLTHPDAGLAKLYEKAKQIRNQLYLLPGTSHIKILGQQAERIYLETTNARMAQYGLTPYHIYNTLQKQNVISPGGVIHTPIFDILLQPTGRFKQLSDIRNVILRLPNTQKLVELGDILKVSRGYVDPPIQPAYFNGKKTIVLAVAMAEKENILQFGQRLNDKLDKIKKQLGTSYQLNYATFQPEQVKQSIHNFTNNLYQTIFIVLIVVVIALGLRTGLLVGSLVPMTILLSIIIMRIFDIELHRVSIASLIISLGLLIDNGIVVGESIYHRIQAGIDRKTAALSVHKDLAIPLLTSSLTTILSFMPLMLAPHVSSEYTRTLSLVILITLIAAWFLAFFVLPLLCYYLVKVKPKAEEDQYQHRIYQWYTRSLTTALHSGKSVLLFVLIMLIGAAFAFQWIPQRFFPESERSQYILEIDLPNGTGIYRTNETVQNILRWLNNKKINPEIKNTLAHVGGGGSRFFLTLQPRDIEPNKAFVLVNTKTKASVSQLVMRTEHFLKTNYPDVRADAKKLWLGTSETGKIELEIYGPSARQLLSLSSVIKKELSGIPNMQNIKNDWGGKTMKFVVNIDMAKAQRAGVSAEDIATSLSSYYSGALLGYFYENDLRLPIILRAEARERAHLELLNTVNIYSAKEQKSYPLTQLAQIKPVFEYNHIKRKNISRIVTVSATNVHLSEAKAKVLLNKIIAKLDLPEGYQVKIAGEIAASTEARTALLSYFPLAFLLMFLLLMWQFNSWRRTFIVLFSIPIGFIGAIAGLLLVQAEFGFMTLLGFMSLAGIIINNAIVLIEKIDSERQQQSDMLTAIVDACITRLRPLFLTALTTALGLLPLILFGGPLWYGMANAIAFGLILGTLITLFVIPVLYHQLSPPLTKQGALS